jgi:hypothetical protein
MGQDENVPYLLVSWGFGVLFLSLNVEGLLDDDGVDGQVVGLMLFEVALHFEADIVENFILLTHFHFFIDNLQFFPENGFVPILEPLFIFLIDNIQFISFLFPLLKLHFDFGNKDSIFTAIFIEDAKQFIVSEANRDEFVVHHFER